MVKRVVIIIFLWLCSVAPAQFPATSYGAGKTDVSLRSSRHDDVIRIVFEAADEAFIKNTSVASSQNQIRVVFPSDAEIRVQGKFELSASLRERTYVISLNGPFKIRTLKLPAPPRLSIDIMPPAKDEIRTSDNKAVEAPPMPNIRVVIDPGHGGYDLGILAGDLREKDATLLIARAVESSLTKKNRTGFLTRKADQFMSISDRAMAANQKFPDVFVSLHFSSTDNFAVFTAQVEPSGSEEVEELYSLSSRQKHYREKSNLLAESIAKALGEDFKREVVLRKMALPLLSSVGAPAVLIEIPPKAMADAAAKGRLSDSLLKGIALYATQ